MMKKLFNKVKWENYGSCLNAKFTVHGEFATIRTIYIKGNGSSASYYFFLSFAVEFKFYSDYLNVWSNYAKE